MIMDGTSLNWYVNNILTETRTDPGGLTGYYNPYNFVTGTYVKSTIGTEWNDIDSTGTSAFQLDDFRFYPRALTPDERASVYVNP